MASLEVFRKKCLRIFQVLQRATPSVCSQFVHVGTVLYYDSEDAKPCALKAMGAFFKTRQRKNFKDVKDPVGEALHWHNDIIRGSGLTYSKEDYPEENKFQTSNCSLEKYVWS